MARFRFRLDTLLKLRMQAREEARRQYALALQAEQLLKDQVHKLDGELQSLQDAARQAGRPGLVQVDQLLENHRFQIVLQAQRQEAERRWRQIQEELLRRQEVLNRAEQEVAVLEKLRDRHQAKYLYETSRQEQLRLEEECRSTQGDMPWPS